MSCSRTVISLPASNYAVCRFHVDAVTVYAVPAPGPYGFFHLGR